MISAEACRGSLLLVEENDEILRSLRDWISLTFPNVRLLEADNHREGEFLSRTERPDAVLMDISGLGKEGVEVVRDMKTANPAAAVFALVTLDHDSYCDAVLKAGADASTCIWNVRGELLPQLKRCLLPSTKKATRQGATVT